MMARKLRPASERGGDGHGPDSIIERTRALIVRERPPVVPSDNRKALAERGVPTPVAGAVPPKLFNRVVRIEGETDYEYFYVLTYLPDLQWCHVGPLEKRGVFAAGSTRGRPGRDRWQLVPEEMGGERDCGASRCHIMEATEVKQTKESADEVSSNPNPNPNPIPNPNPNASLALALTLTLTLTLTRRSGTSSASPRRPRRPPPRPLLRPPPPSRASSSAAGLLQPASRLPPPPRRLSPRAFSQASASRHLLLPARVPAVPAAHSRLRPRPWTWSDDAGGRTARPTVRSGG